MVWTRTRPFWNNEVKDWKMYARKRLQDRRKLKRANRTLSKLKMEKKKKKKKKLYDKQFFQISI